MATVCHKGGVSSPVIMNMRFRGSGSWLYVDTGSVHGRCGDRCASQDRSGGAKRQDSGNNDSSPGAHDFLHGNPEARGPVASADQPANVPALLGFFFPILGLS